MASPWELLSHGQVGLRLWRQDDAAALMAAVMKSQEHLRPWMPWADDHDEDRAVDYLRECEAQRASGDASPMRSSSASQIVGSVGLHRRVGDDGLEIGYWGAR